MPGLREPAPPCKAKWRSVPSSKTSGWRSVLQYRISAAAGKQAAAVQAEWGLRAKPRYFASAFMAFSRPPIVVGYMRLFMSSFTIWIDWR